MTFILGHISSETFSAEFCKMQVSPKHGFCFCQSSKHINVLRQLFMLGAKICTETTFYFLSWGIPGLSRRKKSVQSQITDLCITRPVVRNAQGEHFFFFFLYTISTLKHRRFLTAFFGRICPSSLFKESDFYRWWPQFLFLLRCHITSSELTKSQHSNSLLVLHHALLFFHFKCFSYFLGNIVIYLKGCLLYDIYLFQASCRKSIFSLFSPPYLQKQKSTFKIYVKIVLV